MSRTRQLVSLTTSDARNASAEENALASKPNSRSKSGSDSRTDSSSSTTDTSERLAITDSPWRAPVLSRQASVSGRARREWKMQTSLLDHRSVLPRGGHGGAR